MWQLHLRIRLLRILQKHRIKTGECLTRAGWLELALQKMWVKFHHPLLAVVNKEGFRRQVDETINPCVPPHDGFLNLTQGETEAFYTTFPKEDSEGLQITQRGVRLIGTGGYEHRVYELYKGFWIPITWFITIVITIVTTYMVTTK